ncbi:MAG: hypothetical protein HFE40_02090 [Clostridia bacterium]|nr:hypothetical protein [Clostridia bacterium]
MTKKFFKFIVAAAAVIVICASAVMSACFLFGSTDSKSWMLDTIKKNYYFYDEFNAEGTEDLTLKEIADRLDIYSEYYTPEEIEQVIKDNSGVKAGVGFSYSYVSGEGTPCPDGGVFIVTVVGNSPAEKSGMKPGDVLLSGRHGETEITFENADTISDFIDGISENEEFYLNSAEGESYCVTKQVYSASYTYMATNSKAWTPVFDSAGDVAGLKEVQSETGEKTYVKEISYLPEGAAYVAMSQFYGTAAEEFGALMEKFSAEGCTSLILDLRNNGGGYVTVMQDMAGYFVPSGGSSQTAMTAEYRSGRKELYYISKQKTGLVPSGTQIYVLANSGTASASEALIGVLVSYGCLDYKNIFLSDYGSGYLDWAGAEEKTAQSYGKGIMQTTFTNYATGEALKLTTAKIFWPNGKCIHGVGLTPEDGCRTVKTDWVVTAGDAELQRAVGLINADL